VNELASDGNISTREPVLDTVDRVSELCFGLFMALTFVGTVSAVTAGEDAGQKMLYTALGCNLAWGLADALMFVVRTVTDRGRRLTLALSIKHAPDADAGRRVLRGALPKFMRSILSDESLEEIRLSLAATTNLPDRSRLVRGDFVGALGVFLIIVLSTFPVALPFIIFRDVPTALLVSRALTLVILFCCGLALGRHAGWSRWKAAFSMTAFGVLLTMAIIALGG
jgi:hypothetical protein